MISHLPNQEIICLNLYASKNRALEYVKQKVWEKNKEK